jgi:hypothetical protein
MRIAPLEVTEKIKKKNNSVIISSSYEYGSVLILNSIMQELNLDKYLYGMFKDTEVPMVTALAFNRILRPLAMNHIDSWYRGTTLALDDPKFHSPVSVLVISLQKSDPVISHNN